MATKKASTPAKPKKSGQRPSAGTDIKPVALTLKVDQQTYVRLSTLAARQRSPKQVVLNEALQEHLKRMGA